MAENLIGTVGGVERWAVGAAKLWLRQRTQSCNMCGCRFVVSPSGRKLQELTVELKLCSRVVTVHRSKGKSG